MSYSVAAIILTYNEEKHVERCIKSIKGFVDTIFVIDSYSEDSTVNIAENLGATVYKNTFISHSNQVNWALNNCPIESDWIWRIDADEYPDEKLIENLKQKVLILPIDVSGIYIRRGIVFMGKQLKYGTWGPRWTLKIFRRGIGYCEDKWMDEHIVLRHGRSVQIGGNLIDENLNDLTWWTQKHNHYATKEMIELLFTKYDLKEGNQVSPKLFGTSEQNKRWLKLKYSRLPLFLRPFFNFLYRYLIRFGFLDGKEGFIWHILQGFWYRFLVDAKIFELNIRFGFNQKAISNHLKITYKN